MDALKRSLIEKAGHDFGFEYTVNNTLAVLTLGSATHPLHVEITLEDDDYKLLFANTTSILINELGRDFSVKNNLYTCNSIEQLATVFKRASELAHSLPNQVVDGFEEILNEELNKLPGEIKNTEVERMVRQRVGQDIYRKAMLEYWGGACAVTGVTIHDVLKASHAKPWAECESDQERLDVFNGFLLSANLDALFDKYLITFTNEGIILINDSLGEEELVWLGIKSDMKLRWIAAEHISYLEYHQTKFNIKNKN